MIRNFPCHPLHYSLKFVHFQKILSTLKILSTFPNSKTNSDLLGFVDVIIILPENDKILDDSALQRGEFRGQGDNVKKE